MAVTPLTTDLLRARCNPDQFEFESTATLPSHNGIIGQPRGVRAIEFGISIRSRGYNTYVLGEAGTGRTTTIRRYLEERTRSQPVPDDQLCVHNFRVPHQPHVLSFPAGMGSTFKKEMEQLMAALSVELPRAFNTEQYSEAINAIEARHELQQSLLTRDLERQARENSFTIVKLATGLAIAPVVNGELMNDQQYEALSDPEREQLDSRHRELEEGLAALVKRLRTLEDATRAELQVLQREVAEGVLAPRLATLQAAHAGHTTLPAWLEEVHTDLLDNLVHFFPDKEGGPKSAETAPEANRYAINLLVDNSETEGAPVIVETTPSWGHLMGRIEYDLRDGMMVTHFTNIKAGTLHRANGGYLVIEAVDLLREPFAWEALKRSLKAGQIALQPISTFDSSINRPAKSLEPEPIPLNVKIILLGSAALYHFLFDEDEDFAELFKVKADFSSEMPRVPENEAAYASFIAMRCNEAGLPHFDRGAVARVVEFGSELANHQRRLSTRFGEVGDLVLEAAYQAGQNGNGVVTSADVRQALTERIYRANRLETVIDENISEGTILLSTTGKAVGQINALSVIDMGDYAFGRASRITARAWMGGGGVMHIERETDMADPIHNKGVLTLVGFLGGQYAHDFSLSLSASITFEQNYAGIGGDSASAAELAALLSALVNRPIAQNIAITGSINQRGDIQPVGGVTEKVEGFFRLCSQQGLTGDQGVILPRLNRHELMLSENVIEAVVAGRFSIWTIDHFDDIIPLLFDLEAGAPDEHGHYPADSLHGLVHTRLARMSRKENGEPEREEEEEQEQP
jgi:lon-related putative ATP-dependent protease